MLPSTEFSALCYENPAAMSAFGRSGLVVVSQREESSSSSAQGGCTTVPGVAMGALPPCAALGWGCLQPGSVQQ